MLQVNPRHSGSKTISIHQVPKPFQLKKQSKNKLQSVRSHYADHIQCSKQVLKDKTKLNVLMESELNRSNFPISPKAQNSLHSNRMEDLNFVKKQLSETVQPQGDTNLSPAMSIGELKQLASTRLISQSYDKSKRVVQKSNQKSLSEILKKPNPTLLTTKKRYTDIIKQNKILKNENQMLKQLTVQKKNQVTYLVNQLLDLKLHISNSLESSFANHKKKYGQHDVNENKQLIQQSRSTIAKDIYQRLKELFIKRLKNQDSLFHQPSFSQL